MMDALKALSFLNPAVPPEEIEVQSEPLQYEIPALSRQNSYPDDLLKRSMSARFRYGYGASSPDASSTHGLQTGKSIATPAQLLALKSRIIDISNECRAASDRSSQYLQQAADHLSIDASENGFSECKSSIASAKNRLKERCGHTFVKKTTLNTLRRAIKKVDEVVAQLEAMNLGLATEQPYSASPDVQAGTSSARANSSRSDSATHAAAQEFAAASAESYMLNGDFWRMAGVNSLRELSSTNLHRLQTKLTPLSNDEHEFFDRLTNANLYAVHSTNADVEKDGYVTLLSTRRLATLGNENAGRHTMGSDRSLANDDYIFFSLQCGDKSEINHKKYGGNRYKFDMNSSQFSHAWLSIDDMAFPTKTQLSNNPTNMLIALSDADALFIKEWHESLNGYGLSEKSISEMSDSEYEEYKEYEEYQGYHRSIKNKADFSLRKLDYVFSCQEMAAGIALTIVGMARHLSQEGKSMAMGQDPNFGIDSVVGTFLNVEIKVPQSMVANSEDF